jgi:exopolysaccharide biosynthesis polyprenyl glycosylphosphotransferase
LIFLAVLPLWVLTAHLCGLYERDEAQAAHSTIDELTAVAQVMTIGVWAVVVLSWATGAASPSVPKLVVFWTLAATGVPALRALARSLCRRSLSYLQNTLIVGTGYVGQIIAKKIIAHPEYGLNLVGFVDSDPMEREPDLEHVAVLDGLDSITTFVQEFDVERVVIAFTRNRRRKIGEVMDELREIDVHVDLVPRAFDEIGPRGAIHLIEGIPLIGIPPLRPSRSSLLLKRVADLAVSAVALLLLSPVFALIALLVKLDSHGPAFYRHERVGRNEKPFRLLKFRTMGLDYCRGEDYGGEHAEAAFAKLMTDPRYRSEFESTQKLQSDPRVTRVGSFLRSTSLDEFPQLVNVVLGHISLVGPRPITHEELYRYGDRVHKVLQVRPGVTGYWQINGRSNLTYDDRVRLDLGYCNNWSLGQDLTILAKTVRVMLRRGEAC